MKHHRIESAWTKRTELYAECDKLCAKGNKLQAEGNKLYAEGDKLQAEGDKLYAEGDKLQAEGSKLRAKGWKIQAEGWKIYAQAVIEQYGKQAIIDWKTGEITTETTTTTYKRADIDRAEHLAQADRASFRPRKG